MDRLRIFEEDGVSQAGAGGGIMALLHLSATFGEGWLRFWLNNSEQPIKVKSESGNFVRIRGLTVTIQRIGVGGMLARRDSAKELELRGRTGKTGERKITGVRVLFKTKEEKKGFLELVERARGIPLPGI